MIDHYLPSISNHVFNHKAIFMKNLACTIPTTMSFTFAIVGSNPTMTIVANPIIFNIRVLVPSSIGKVTSLNVETLDYIVYL